MRTPWLLVLPLLLAGSAPAGTPTDPTALIDRAIRASGGREQVARLHAVSWKTQVTLPDSGQEVLYTDESTAQGLDQYRADLESKEQGQWQQATLVVNKKRAWFRNRGKTIDAHGAYLRTRRQVYLALRLPELLLPLKGKSYRLSPLGEVLLDGRPAVGVRAAHAGQPAVNLYFDKATGLFAGSECRLKAPDGREAVVEYRVSAYKDFDGVKHFTKATLVLEGRPFLTAELSELRPLGRLDEAAFAEPGAATGTD